MTAPGPFRAIIPTRGRPQHVARTAEAWMETGAYDAGVPVSYVLDRSDARRAEYLHEIEQHWGDLAVVHDAPEGEGYRAAVNAAGRALVRVDRDGLAREDDGLAGSAWQAAGYSPATGQTQLFTRPWAVAVLGDDHLPRTEGWYEAMAAALAEMGTGVVYGDDLLRGRALPTAWAMTADIVRVTGRIIPCLARHLYTDTSVGALASAAGCLRYLPDVVIEHMHYTNGKAEPDAGYLAENSRERNREDKFRYERWLNGKRFPLQLEAVRALRRGLADES